MSALFEMVKVDAVEYQVVAYFFLLLLTLLAKFALVVGLPELL